MVGVAGRSKGCHTCRRRKIRCDQRKPGCERCERTGRVCEGYARGTIFLNQTGFGGAQDRTQLSQSPPEGDSRIQIFAATPETYRRQNKKTASPPKTSPKSQTQRFNIATTFAAANSYSNSNSALSLHNSASLHQLDSMCLERMCPIPSQRAIFSLTMLAPRLLASLKAEPVFIHAFNALKLSMPYPGSRNPAWIHQGREEYGKALKAMQQSIADQPSEVSDSALLACTLMKQYELQELSERTASAFDAHVNGHLALIKARGPKSLKSDYGRAMVREARYLDALTSLSNHSRCELGSIAWRCPEIWRDDHDVRLSLLDIATDAGAIFEDHKNLSEDCAYFEWANVAQRAIQIHRDLFAWHRKLNAHVTLDPPWPTFDSVPERFLPASPESDIVDIQISIDKLEQQYSQIDFWAICIIANELSELIRTSWPQWPDSHPWPNECGPRITMEERQIRLSANILEIAELVTADECGMWGMLRTAWGLRNAFTSLKKFSSPVAADLRTKLEETLGRMAARDYRPAVEQMPAPEAGSIQSAYAAGNVFTPSSTSSEELELPEVLARSTI